MELVELSGVKLAKTAAAYINLADGREIQTRLEGKRVPSYGWSLEYQLANLKSDWKTNLCQRETPE
jgi:hypothetical protein